MEEGQGAEPGDASVILEEDDRCLLITSYTPDTCYFKTGERVCDECHPDECHDLFISDGNCYGGWFSSQSSSCQQCAIMNTIMGTLPAVPRKDDQPFHAVPREVVSTIRDCAWFVKSCDDARPAHPPSDELVQQFKKNL